ncbi:MAG: hypothetical protein NT040_01640 [Bacteroidetes bacterium]|nr:hypothetical protein [Bacteroidota bacterium]
MSPHNQAYFEALKQKIVAIMQQSYPGINPSISDWKGQEITDFQEELRLKVNARISEKWFYTHMKSGKSSVPRIDMLNLLSRYAGYANWDDFVYHNSEITGDASVAIPAPKSANRFFLLVPMLALLVVLIFYGLFKLFNTREYRFSFYDADTREPITGSPVEVTLLSDGESPVKNLVSPDGSFLLKTDQSLIRMVVKAPYYRSDTITRMVKKLNREEKVMLHADDYALMIHYYSMMKVDDWQKRRTRLEAMIDDAAVICQVVSDKEATGMALFNKDEFIDKMTMPAGSLKNIEILGSQMRENKIMVLRFRVNTKRK